MTSCRWRSLPLRERTGQSAISPLLGSLSRHAQMPEPNSPDLLPYDRHADRHQGGMAETAQQAIGGRSPVIDAFHRIYYDSRVWTSTYWRGHRIEKFPTDLVTYQEILADVRPKLVVECGTRFGGSALFLGD